MYFFSNRNFPHFIVKRVYLTKAKFAKVPDFRRTKLSAHFDPKGITVDFMEDKNGERFMGFLCKKAADMEDAGRLCRLKELASIAKDHKASNHIISNALFCTPPWQQDCCVPRSGICHTGK